MKDDDTLMEFKGMWMHLTELGLMKKSDKELIKLILSDRAVVQSGVDEKIKYLDERKMLKAVEEAEMRFGQFAERNQSPRYSTGNKFLDPYVAVLSKRLTPAVAQKLLERTMTLRQTFTTRSPPWHCGLWVWVTRSKTRRGQRMEDLKRWTISFWRCATR